jgi:hypothetical protein
VSTFLAEPLDPCSLALRLPKREFRRRPLPLAERLKMLQQQKPFSLNIPEPTVAQASVANFLFAESPEGSSASISGQQLTEQSALDKSALKPHTCTQEDRTVKEKKSEDKPDQRMSAMVTRAYRDKIEAAAAAHNWDVAGLVRRGIEAMVDPATAMVKFEPEVYDTLIEVAQSKLWDLNTLVRAAVMAQYPEAFGKKKKDSK